MNRSTHDYEWWDYSWNPVVGCSPKSAGCAKCYAAAISKRFGRPWGKPVFKPERLGEPAKLKKPSRVFVCSMSDIGHPELAPQHRMSVYFAMRQAPWHQYIVLTKRPTHLRLWAIPDHVWVGVTVENEKQYRRWQWLRSRWPGTSFVSVEPMLEPVTFDGVPPEWVIAGPETGPHARECKPEWIEALSAQSTCFFDKRHQPGVRREWPEGMMKETP